ncbi:MAG TPA: hypothetical protein VHV10_07835 [Ktedonobacteraceae bacterium]|jgi:hypothetical protein|nr:hypothetical protein [Ktedonobacteraceae bacterium]
MKYQFIEQYKQGFPVVVMCQVLAVFESGFYAWRKRPACQRHREDDTISHKRCNEETLALETLSEAVRLAEPEGYIRSFVDAGAQIEALLYQMRKRDRRNGPTPYLDALLTTFQQESNEEL